MDDNRLRDIVQRKIKGLPAEPTDDEKNEICRAQGCDNDLSKPGRFDGFCADCAKVRFRRGDWHTPPML